MLKPKAGGQKAGGAAEIEFEALLFVFAAAAMSFAPIARALALGDTMVYVARCAEVSSSIDRATARRVKMSGGK